MAWGNGRRIHLQTMLEHATAQAQQGHRAILNQLEANKGVLLEHLQHVDEKIDKMEVEMVALGVKVQDLATWRGGIMMLAKISAVLWPILLALIAGLWFLFTNLQRVPKP